MWRKSIRLKHNWGSDQSQLTGIERHRLFATAICWLTYRHEHTINSIIVQTPPSKFFKSEQVKHVKSLDNELKNFV